MYVHILYIYIHVSLGHTRATNFTTTQSLSFKTKASLTKNSVLNELLLKSREILQKSYSEKRNPTDILFK